MSEEATKERYTGKVKFFSGKGYGFITPEGKEDIEESGLFFHISEVEHRETLETDQSVTYQVAPGREKGQQQAVRIEKIQELEREE